MIEQSEMYVNGVGTGIWYLPSKGIYYYHRLDGPAIEQLDGTKEWWLDGKRHRLDRPAIEHVNGTKEWWVDHKLHRIDGPAFERKDDYKEWWVDGKRHRIDGPAIEWENGRNKWYVNDNKLPTEKVELWLKENNVDLKTDEGQMAFKLRWT